MQKVLFVNFEKCTGCRKCEVACSLYNDKECNPTVSRIHVISWMRDGVDVPMLCLQCEEPMCKTACFMNAIRRDSKTGAMVIDYDKCVGCKMCMYYCPLGGITFDPENKRVLKCDLCGGVPKCAKYCTTKAIEYVAPTRAILKRQRQFIEKFGDLTGRLSPT